MRNIFQPQVVLDQNVTNWGCHVDQLLGNLERGCSINIDATADPSTISFVASNLPFGCGFYLGPGLSNAQVEAAAKSLSQNCYLVLDPEMREDLLRVAVMNLNAGRGVALHAFMPMRNIYLVLEKLNINCTLLFDPNMLVEPTIATIARGLKCGSRLALPAQLHSDKLTKAAANLSDNSFLLLHSDSDRNLVITAAQNLRCGCILTLHERASQDIILAAAENIRSGCFLCYNLFSSNNARITEQVSKLLYMRESYLFLPIQPHREIPWGSFYQMAQTLFSRSSLALPASLVQDQAKYIAINWPRHTNLVLFPQDITNLVSIVRALEPPCGLVIHNDLTIPMIEALVAELSRGPHLVLASSLTTDKAKKAVQTLPRYGHLFLTNHISLALINASVRWLQRDCVLSLDKDMAQDKIVAAAASLPAHNYLRLDHNMSEDKVIAAVRVIQPGCDLILSHFMANFAENAARVLPNGVYIYLSDDIDIGLAREIFHLAGGRVRCDARNVSPELFAQLEGWRLHPLPFAAP